MYKYNSDKGFSTGLIMWLLCLFILVILGIQPIISVLFGAAAGAATWLIVAYWNFEPIPPEKDTKPSEEPTPGVFGRLRLPILTSEESKMPNPFARRKPRKRI